MHTDSRSLKDQWRTESATADNDLLACPVSLGDVLVGVQGLGWNSANTDRTVALQDDLVNFGVASKVEVLVLGTSAVNVAVSRVRTTSGIAMEMLDIVSHVAWR